jgi:hypothetical protein
MDLGIEKETGKKNHQNKKGADRIRAALQSTAIIS